MTEVAELTNSIAVRNAAAKAVAVSRAGAKVANIALSLFVVSTHHWADADINAGTVPNWNYPTKSV